MTTFKEALRKLSDEDLKKLSEECHNVSPKTHSPDACFQALHGIEVDIEISRRRRESLANSKKK